ncbi:MAG: hypothetical protein JNM18_01555 [Planctomycetaceae bacterium]|nr:hypothetical protein [Planctomycetaceae bacterium]
MWNCRLGLDWSWCVIVSLVIVASATPANSEEKATPSDPTTRDILDIRERLGLRLFEGTVFGKKGRDKQAAEPQAGGLKASAPNDVDDVTVFSKKIEKLASTPANERNPLPPPVQLDPITTGFDRRPAARGLARQLDLLAADFEDQEFFEEADRLRGMARSLRLRARDRGEPVSPELPVPPPVDEPEAKTERR